MTLPALQHATFLECCATGNVFSESRETHWALHGSSQLSCIKEREI